MIVQQRRAYLYQCCNVRRRLSSHRALVYFDSTNKFIMSEHRALCNGFGSFRFRRIRPVRTMSNLSLDESTKLHDQNTEEKQSRCTSVSPNEAASSVGIARGAAEAPTDHFGERVTLTPCNDAFSSGKVLAIRALQASAGSAQSRDHKTLNPASGSLLKESESTSYPSEADKAAFLVSLSIFITPVQSAHICLAIPAMQNRAKRVHDECCHTVRKMDTENSDATSEQNDSR